MRLAGVAKWLGINLGTRSVWFPVRAHVTVSGYIPSRGHMGGS